MDNIINRFISRTKAAFTPPKKITISRPCIGTTNILRWTKWIEESNGEIEWNIITSKNGESLYIVYPKS